MEKDITEITETEVVGAKQVRESLVDESLLEADRQKLADQLARKEEKKRLKKKKRRRIILIVVLVLVIIAGIITASILIKKKKANTETTVSVEVGRGETVQYATIVSIVGNDMDVRYTEETTSSSDSSSRPSMPGGGDGSSMPSMPSGDGSSMPSMPSDGSMPDFGQGGPSATSNEVKSLQIPVGTDVYTKLGNVTTFSRLAAGDTIAIIFEEGTENILRIYMQ